jgi:hypothetical protein
MLALVQPPFEAWHFRDLAGELHDALAKLEARAAPAAARMHVDRVSDHIAQVSIYETSNGYPRHMKPFGEVFASWADFLAALQDESPGAIEAGIDVLSRVEPKAAMPIALAIFERRPWNMLWDAAARALARCDDERAFATLLANAAEYGVGGRIAASEYTGGLDVALALVAKEPPFVASLLSYVGKLRADAGWSALAERWRTRGDSASGHPLLRWGDSRSLDLLESTVHEDERWRRFFGVAAHLERDPEHVVDRLGGHEALVKRESMPLVRELLEQLGRRLLSARSGDSPLSPQPAYLDLALAWVKEKPTKSVAQWVIDAYPKAEVTAAKKRLGVAPAVKKRASRVVTTRDDAMTATMTKARQNLECIVARLKQRGYMFVAPRDVLLRPTTASKRALARLEKAVGPLPASLRAAYEIIVGCDLRGSHPEWARFASVELAGAKEPIWHTDPFVLIPAVSLVDEAEEHSGDEAAYALAFAPDDVGKAGYSGGGVTIDVPCDEADPIIEGLHDEMTFVGHLREVFRWGGFPGFARIDPRPRALLDELASLCTPI